MSTVENVEGHNEVNSSCPTVELSRPPQVGTIHNRLRYASCCESCEMVAIPADRLQRHVRQLGTWLNGYRFWHHTAIAPRHSLTTTFRKVIDRDAAIACSERVATFPRDVLPLG